MGAVNTRQSGRLSGFGASRPTRRPLVKRVDQLREQARGLRTLSMSFEEMSIRERLQALGAQCEDLAADIEKMLKAKLSEPIDAGAKSMNT